MKFVYEAVCTYVVEADDRSAASRVAGSVAQGLASTGILRSSGGSGTATLRSTTARALREAAKAPGAVKTYSAR